MAIQNRNILGPANPFDSGEKAVTYTPGGDDSLKAPHASGPHGVTDQSSAEFAPRASLNEAQFRQAQNVARGISSAGAPGEQVGRGPDAFHTTGNAGYGDGTGADIVAPEGDNMSQRGASFTTWDNAAGGMSIA